jgi:hypothetical protein
LGTADDVKKPVPLIWGLKTNEKKVLIMECDKKSCIEAHQLLHRDVSAFEMRKLLYKFWSCLKNI